MHRTHDISRNRSPEERAQDHARLAELFVQFMTKTLQQRLVVGLPEARAYDLTLAQAQALRFLYLHGTVYIGEIADGLDTSYPSATNMVTRLEEKGLVRRVSVPEDRRAVEVVLTDCGRALVEKLEEERRAGFHRILERMPAEERDALLAGLRRFVSLAVDADAGVADEICLRCGWRASSDCPLAEVIPLSACR